MVVGRQSFLVGKLYVQGLLLLVQGTVVHHGSPTCFYPDTTEISLTVVFGPVFFCRAGQTSWAQRKIHLILYAYKTTCWKSNHQFFMCWFRLYHHPKRINTFCQWWLTFREPNHINQCCRGTLVLQHMFLFTRFKLFDQTILICKVTF